MTKWSILRRLKVENRQTWLLENWIGDLAVIVNFPLEDDPNTLMVAWTTTPWTLPSNLALCVHPDLVYVKVQGELTFWNISRLFFFSYTTQSQSLCYSVGLFYQRGLFQYSLSSSHPCPVITVTVDWAFISVYSPAPLLTLCPIFTACTYVCVSVCPCPLQHFIFLCYFCVCLFFLQKRAAVYITLTRMGHNKVVYWQVYGLQKL